MRILYLAQRVPFPPNRGDKITTYHHIRHLARNHEVTVACLADGTADLSHANELAGFVQSIDAVPLRRRWARLRALAAVARGRPFTVGYFRERELHKRIADRMCGTRFDMAIVYSSGMAQFVEQYSDIPRVMYFADLDSLKWQAYAQRCFFPKSWLYRREHRLLLEYELSIARTFTYSLLCTPRELDDLKRLMPNAPADWVGNGVDLNYFRPMTATKKPHELIFTGVMDYYPNVEGVTWFCREVLPRVRREVPDVTLTICGARPSRQVLALQRLAGISVTGRVADVRPYLAQASIAVVPLRIARGVQNKLLEALAMGLPTVACSAAALGVHGVDGRYFFVADFADQFAEATVRLLRDPALRERTGEAARASIEANYRWDHQLARLDRVMEKALHGVSLN
jgi:sugar transferase (PEP-CTERM/EpsH1 system associated)